MSAQIVYPPKFLVAGSVVLGLLFTTAGCSGVLPSEGSGEVQEQAEEPRGLADEVKSAIDDALSAANGEDGSLSQVDEYENVSTEAIRVRVEADLDASQREQLAAEIFGAASADALEAVMIVDADGEETSHNRSE